MPMMSLPKPDPLPKNVYEWMHQNDTFFGVDAAEMNIVNALHNFIGRIQTGASTNFWQEYMELQMLLESYEKQRNDVLLGAGRDLFERYCANEAE